MGTEELRQKLACDTTLTGVDIPISTNSRPARAGCTAHGGTVINGGGISWQELGDESRLTSNGLISTESSAVWVAIGAAVSGAGVGESTTETG